VCHNLQKTSADFSKVINVSIYKIPIFNNYTPLASYRDRLLFVITLHFVYIAIDRVLQDKVREMIYP